MVEERTGNGNYLSTNNFVVVIIGQKAFTNGYKEPKGIFFVTKN